MVLSVVLGLFQGEMLANRELTIAVLLAITGAAILINLVARRLFAPTELPVGVITGVVGAPYLLWLLARSNRVGRGG